MQNYTLIRSARRTLALEINREGALFVRAPLYSSKGEIERFVSQHEDWIEKHLLRQQARLAAHPEPDEAQRAALIARAEEEIPPKVLKYAGIMGLSPAGISITDARRRFGSCSYKNRLCFAWRLMQYPEEAVDYVVVHELAHIVHKNHGKEFYVLIASVLPDYKSRQELLKE